ncbi:MAG: CehA/McbA family metallohydrolase [Acidobacteria bacterium]|nr:CehA/McbA family metallohydrolase [Acidobacteriota bacterium]
MVAALVAAAIPFLLPRPHATTPAPHWPPHTQAVRGVYHVHSTISDGTGSADQIAAAAARAGLQFVILTDHGDGTRVAAPPRYLSGVLVIEGVEINTSAGHVVALGARPSSYPLAGSAHAVVEDVQRLGGMAIAAHPDSPRESLAWRDWSVPLDGLEWLNADSQWRDELVGSLGRFLLTYALRPVETLASTLDRPVDLLRRWDTMTATRRLTGMAGADAHARLGWRQRSEPYDEGRFLEVPSYEASFRAFGQRVVLDAPLSGDAARDAEAILSRLRWGRTYTVIDGMATPGAFEFTATSSAQWAHMGDYLDLRGEIALHARVAAPPGFRIVFLRDGNYWFDSTEPEVHLAVPAEPAAYRVEVEIPDAFGRPPIPWIVSNPIYVGLRDAHAAARVAAAPPPSARTPIATGAWVAEASAGSTIRLVLRGPGEGPLLAWEYALADGSVAAPYAAIRFPVAALGGHDRFQLHGRADGPVRLSVQLRDSTRTSGERWGDTVYLDATGRVAEVFFDRMTPLGDTTQASPPLDRVDSLLLVIDTLNARPGTRGTIEMSELWLGKP